MSTSEGSQSVGNASFNSGTGTGGAGSVVSDNSDARALGALAEKCVGTGVQSC